MGCISTIDLQVRMDLHEVLSRFCIALDRGQTNAWSNLFTADATFVWQNDEALQGRDALALIPDKCAALGLRHHFSSIVLDRLESPKSMRCQATCIVTDWQDRAKISDVLDCDIVFRKTSNWQIVEVNARSAHHARPACPKREDQPAAGEAKSSINSPSFH
ncbi:MULTISPECIES: nuclear transport factor 2 family protein [unclassified Sphingobium]|uniref:nuclear transport factor 2 family protein n=1 Tax=unclassified Sphingobium TaxID=2611147 RepID=UPI000D17BDB6|nr:MULTISPECIES: nuclear transport factor 2 family protein [unclassified Sphingobium]MBG6119994.1 hypothetical protein [Sphingobium sp. JAI105]PSO12942.1 hypothetical protein C7E20_04130 [Sphingobium sp. AEW4]TWD05804.1 SnoaL-like protein [Sphingobium sp. AEW010]TWD23357.1 SnoaL-like protein [Sphingobium sp. AEW013]TWD25217.1 SnoaL-like protein [Sphingobium sp. AEW001]